MNARLGFRPLTSVVTAAACLGQASAQQVAGTLGLATATTVERGQLRLPDPECSDVSNDWRRAR